MLDTWRSRLLCLPWGALLMRSHDDSERLLRFVRFSEWPLAILALAIVPSLLLDDFEGNPQIHRASEILNWIVWLAFCGEIAIKVRLSGNAREFFRHTWFDLVIVAASPPFLGPGYLQGIR